MHKIDFFLRGINLVEELWLEEEIGGVKSKFSLFCENDEVVVGILGKIL